MHFTIKFMYAEYCLIPLFYFCTVQLLASTPIDILNELCIWKCYNEILLFLQFLNRICAGKIKQKFSQHFIIKSIYFLYTYFPAINDVTLCIASVADAGGREQQAACRAAAVSGGSQAGLPSQRQCPQLRGHHHVPSKAGLTEFVLNLIVVISFLNRQTDIDKYL